MVRYLNMNLLIPLVIILTIISNLPHLNSLVKFLLNGLLVFSVCTLSIFINLYYESLPSPKKTILTYLLQWLIKENYDFFQLDCSMVEVYPFVRMYILVGVICSLLLKFFWRFSFYDM